MSTNHAIPAGFTLVETLVAITILMVTITTPFYAIDQSLNASHAARDELISNALAQEGIEYARELRDDQALIMSGQSASNPAIAALQTCTAPNKCIVDPTNAIVTLCTGGNCAATPLYLDNSNRYNQVAAGTPTRFTRSVQLSTINALTGEYKVTVTVTWTSDHRNYTTTINEFLFAPS